VVANGCSGDTAEVVRQVWERVDVVETDVLSKSNALNLGSLDYEPPECTVGVLTTSGSETIPVGSNGFGQV
jgi:hypothetical protein